MLLYLINVTNTIVDRGEISNVITTLRPIFEHCGDDQLRAVWEEKEKLFITN